MKQQEAVATPTLAITAEQLQEMMTAIVREARKPTEAEQKKLDDEARKLAAQQKQRLELQKVELQRRENLRKFCAHGTVHPGTGAFQHAWRAQVHTPANTRAYFVPTCQQCQTQVGKVYATPEQVSNGVNLKDVPGLTLATVEKWVAEYGEKIA